MRRRLLGAFIALLLCAAALAMLTRRQFVVSRAMTPTLQTGDTFLMSRLSYGVSRHSFASLARYFPDRLWSSMPQRGDVAVVKLPRDGQSDFVSRVIGLPGERVQMRAGRLYINDLLVEREALAPAIIADRDGKAVNVPAYAETLPGGVRHDIIEAEGDTGRLDTTAMFDVPPGYYFLMGDNRDSSVDSRLPEAYGLGFVPFGNFVGRALIVVWSADADLGGPLSASRVQWNRVLHRLR